MLLLSELHRVVQTISDVCLKVPSWLYPVFTQSKSHWFPPEICIILAVWLFKQIFRYIKFGQYSKINLLKVIYWFTNTLLAISMLLHCSVAERYVSAFLHCHPHFRSVSCHMSPMQVREQCQSLLAEANQAASGYWLILVSSFCFCWRRTSVSVLSLKTIY